MNLTPTFGIVALCLLCGCGGGGSQPMRSAAIDIAWAAPVRGFSGPASAESAVISIANTDAFQVTPHTTLVNRQSSQTAYETTYDVETNAVPGPGYVNVTFYSGKDGQGTVVGTAHAGGALTSQGTFLGPNFQPLGAIVTIGPVASVSIVNNGLSVKVGATSYLVLTASDANGNVIATDPGLGAWTEQTTSFASLTSTGTLTGIAPGATTVTVTYNGITSPPATITVTGP